MDYPLGILDCPHWVDQSEAASHTMRHVLSLPLIRFPFALDRGERGSVLNSYCVDNFPCPWGLVSIWMKILMRLPINRTYLIYRKVCSVQATSLKSSQDDFVVSLLAFSNYTTVEVEQEIFPEASLVGGEKVAKAIASFDSFFLLIALSLVCRVAQIVGLSRNMTSFRIIFSESVCSTFATKSVVF